MKWTPRAGLADIMRQGFMKPRKRRVAPVELPIVACERCGTARAKHVKKKTSP